MQEHTDRLRSIVKSAIVLSVAAFIAAGCEKSTEPDLSAAMSREMESAASEPFLPNNRDEDLHPATLKELQSARSATARYKDIRHALEDGYTDINLAVKNMGRHYMNFSLRDDGGVFDPRKPEILVYDVLENADGTFRYELGAVEYAVLISDSPNEPEGFYGNHDKWTKNVGAGMWLLHAWVWKSNPAGVFVPFNSTVYPHVH